MGKARKPKVAEAGEVAAERAKLCARIADDKKAEDILILDLRPLQYVTDFFILATGRNERQRAAIAGEIQARMRELGDRPYGVAGERTAQWILADYVDFVVHIFSPDARRLYDLELLWGDAPRLEWRQ